MDRHWINIPNKLSAEYAAGMNEFISVARHSMDSNGMVLCPCCRCVNKKSQYMHVIKLHLIIHGFLSSYTRWYHHGEQIEEVEDEGLFDTEDNVEDSNHDDLDAGLHDDIGSKYFDIGPTSDFNDESPFNVDDKYDALFESLHKSFDDLLEFLREILPEGNHCPMNYYQTRKLLCEVGLGYEQIDVCQYDCALFYGEYENAVSCPVCSVLSISVDD
uniref:Transposase-associated domain-containing protein n=1 Tax=Cannabis sativa TaxID=3483 RepID=A0A803QHC9_CANSA